MLKELLKGLALVLALVLLAAATLFAVAYWQSEQALDQRYSINDPPLTVLDTPEAVARGEHLYSVLGCVECHGVAGVGKVVIDAGPVGRYVAPNLTPAQLPAAYDDSTLGVAIRHAVSHDGRPLRIMPSGDFNLLSEADTAALVAYLRALPPVQNDPGQTRVGPLGRLLYLFGEFHLVPAESIDHRPHQRAAPEPGPSAEYGAYLAQACTGCHGADWAGQHVPGTPPELPDAANLTPHADGLAGWTLADFDAAVRRGQRPDGRALHPFMPWGAYAKMTDDEVAAIWAHLSALPPVPDRKR